MLERYFREKGNGVAAARAKRQAHRCADTLASHLSEEGYIPAILDEGCDSRIIPAIEGLAFPYEAGCRERRRKTGSTGRISGP